jgi:SRSO17 transposase
LEEYAARFDDLFGSLAQRRGFREYLAGLLAARDRNKTLTALAGAEPVAGAGHPAVQRLQFFLSESRWDPEGGQCPPAGAAAGRPGNRAARRRGAGD